MLGSRVSVKQLRTELENMVSVLVSLVEHNDVGD